ncbi:MAG: nickel-dependent hydrogenase large subunit [Candidatus Methanomethyliaceae archaeon]|nr:nickel-dependent hydrogenase large subunit [Candidatus Methanomethyliaceae archaeon]MDW7970922.1 nickel-dependent hydrogenase large subunit [Nitrososphaerota archaeon]
MMERKVVEKEISIGPVHPALIEPYRIRLFVNDEIVEDCEININMAYRGIERLLEGLPVEKALLITERVCGICSNVHTWNSVRVVEAGLRIEVPDRANYIRVLINEIQRIASHLIFFGHAFEVLGHETFAMRSFLLREVFMDLMAYIGGNRVMPAVPVIGGIRPRADLTDSLKRVISERINDFEKKYREYVERILADSMIMSRLTGVGLLSKEDAIKYHATGPNGRASGWNYDIRTLMHEYEPFDFEVIVLNEGDNKARVVQRALEVFECLKIIRQILKNLPEGPIVNRDWIPGKMNYTISYFEAFRGELMHSCALDSQGLIRGYKIRTPTPTNLAAMERACVGDHITDAILTIASCDPCLTCCTRVEVINFDESKTMTVMDIMKKYGRR